MTTITFRKTKPKGKGDIDGQNRDRARWALTAVEAFVRETNVDPEDCLSDLLCDLMHLCDYAASPRLFERDFGAALSRAEGHYYQESAL